MNLYNKIKKQLILTLKIAVIIFMAVGVNVGTDYVLAESNGDFMRGGNVENTVISVDIKNLNQQNIKDKFLKTVNLFLKKSANTVLAQGDSTSGATYTTTCGWVISQVSDLIQYASGDDIAYSNYNWEWPTNCTDADGTDKGEIPPLCASNAIEVASVSCYPTDVALDSSLMVLVELDEGTDPTDPGGDGEVHINLKPGTPQVAGATYVNSFGFMSRESMVGVCDRVCVVQ